MRLSIRFLCGCIFFFNFGSPVASEQDTARTSLQANNYAGELDAPHISTFSIVARDPETGDYGIAVQSRFFAVGNVVPHAAADVGAVATQARANLLYGPLGLRLLAQGTTANEVIQRLVAIDPLRDERQIGVVDRNGSPASYTGANCLPWAGSRIGVNYAVQGNLLAGPQVVDAIATVFEASQGDFAQRLIDALAAGQAAGGDARGRQSAALLIVRERGGYLGLTDRLVDLHVEDHATPIRELSRLLRIRQSQLASERAWTLLAQAEGDQESRGELLAEARTFLLKAVAKHPANDIGWWYLAKVYQLEGRSADAVIAARRALLENPTWRLLSPITRESLGISAEFLDELLIDESFRHFWNSLAPVDQTVRP